MKNNVIIYQSVIPHYRRIFFEKLEKILDLKNYDLEIKNKETEYFYKYFLLFKNSYSKNEILVYPFSIRKKEIYALIISTWLCRIIGYEKKNTVVWWNIGHMPSEKFWIKLVRKVLMQITDKVVLYTEKERYLYSVLGESRVKFYSFNNCIDETASRKLHKKENNKIKIVGYTGTMHSRSNANYLPEIIKLTLKLQPNLKFEIIGSGNFEASIKEKLRDEHRVTFHGEITDQNVVSKIMATWDLGIYPGAVGLTAQTFLHNLVPYITIDDPFHQSPEHCGLPDDLKLSVEKLSENDFANKIISTIMDNKEVQRIREDMFYYRKYFTVERAAYRFFLALTDE